MSLVSLSALLAAAGPPAGVVVPGPRVVREQVSLPGAAIPFEVALRQGLPRGGKTTYQGSARAPYVLTHHSDGNWSCTCPAWRFQSRGTTRTCRHLVALRGAAAQSARTEVRQQEPERRVSRNPSGPDPLKGGLLLAVPLEPGLDPTGWWMSEKFNGVRALWTGDGFYSRNGNRFAAPAWFEAMMPGGTEFDGEFWIGRGRGVLHRTFGIVSKDVPIDEEWRQVRFQTFDMPGLARPFEERLAALRAIQPRLGSHVDVVQHVRCEGRAHLQAFLEEVLSRRGEGVMLRKPKSRYERTRSPTLVKVKTTDDAEARIVEHLPGTGQNRGRFGSYRCELLDSGVEFKVKILVDAQRDRPLPVGTIVTVAYAELTPEGRPFQPRLVGPRPAMDVPTRR